MTAFLSIKSVGQKISFYYFLFVICPKNSQSNICEPFFIYFRQIISVKYTFTNVCKIISQKQKNCFLIFFKQKFNDLANSTLHGCDITIYLDKIFFFKTSKRVSHRQRGFIFYLFFLSFKNHVCQNFPHSFKMGRNSCNSIGHNLF